MSHNYIGSQLCLPTYPLAALQHPLPPHFAFLGVGGQYFTYVRVHVFLRA